MGSDWRLWQWIDSAFPAGAFAHSNGLEAAWQAGDVGSSEALRDFVRSSLLQNAAGPAAFVRATHDDVDHLADIDVRCDAFLSTAVANRASRRQGQALLNSATTIFQLPGLRELKARAAADALPVHVAPYFGAIARLVGFERDATLSAFLFSSVRTTTSSAVRLGIVGPLEAQSIQLAMAEEADRLVPLVPPLPYTRAAQTSPLLDIYQGLHDRLYSKLFQS